MPRLRARVHQVTRLAERSDPIDQEHAASTAATVQGAPEIRRKSIARVDLRCRQRNVAHEAPRLGSRNRRHGQADTCQGESETRVGDIPFRHLAQRIDRCNGIPLEKCLRPVDSEAINLTPVDVAKIIRHHQ